MFEILKRLWKNTYDYKQELSQGGIFAISLVTLNVVFPPAVLPTLFTLGTLALGVALYYTGSLTASFFAKREVKPAIEKPIYTTDSLDQAESKKSSTATMQFEMEAHKIVEAENEQSIENVETPRETLNPSPAVSYVEMNDFTLENEAEAGRNAAMGMGG